METINEKRVEALTGSMENVAKYIDDVAKFLSDNMNKAIDGNSWKDYMTGALFGGGLIGMAISRKVRTSRTNTQIIYNGMTADDMGRDIVNQVKKLVSYQSEIQRLVGKYDEGNYYNLVEFVYHYAAKYHAAWLSFASFYVTNHKVDYDGERMTLEEMVKKQWSKELLRLDMRDDTRKAIEKNLR